MKKQITSIKMLFLSLFLSVTTNTFSASVKSEIAQTVAVNFIQQKTGEAKKISNVVVEEFQGKPSVYGINFEGGGWVLVSTKDEMWPILAYNTKGQYHSGKESTNENFQNFLKMYGTASATIDSLQKEFKITDITDTTALILDSSIVDPTKVKLFMKEIGNAQSKWKSLLNPSKLRAYTPGTVLLEDKRGENKWNQTTDKNGEWIYNNDCPTDPNDDNCRTVVGCPAIALSQVLWKWKWPDFAEISQGAYLESENSNRKIFQKPEKLLRGTTSYDGFDWNLIPAELVKSETPTNQINETTRLLRQAGEAIHVSYGCDGTGIDAFEAYDLYPHAYKDMGYNCYGNVMSEYYFQSGGKWINPDFGWTDDQWNQLIKTEIEAGRPVNYCNAGYDPFYYYMYGYAVSVGHTYVVSGYDIDDQYYFYCNLGWGGDSDGYYYIIKGNLLFDALSGFVHSATVGVSPKYPTVSGDICLDYKEVNEGETKGKNAKENIILPCDDKFDVYSDGTLKLRAGKMITLKAGFSAHSGSTLNAKILPEFAENHEIEVSVVNISDGAKGKLEFNVKNANSWYLTIRDLENKVQTRNSGYIAEDGNVLIWTGSIRNCIFEVTFLNNFGHIETYSGNFASNKLTKIEKPTIEDPADIFSNLNRNSEYYAFSSNGPLTDLIETSSTSQNLSIYPNPTNGVVYIKVSDDTINSITVTNMTGKVLVEKAVNADQTDIDLSSYNKGIYLVKVVTANDSYIEKVVLK